MDKITTEIASKIFLLLKDEKFRNVAELPVKELITFLHEYEALSRSKCK